MPQQLLWFIIMEYISLIEYTEFYQFKVVFKNEMERLMGIFTYFIF